ncbi:hypothetical protein SCG7086_BG_00020 [Chlamydiales bacterium SCGC AG-110-P3]|nr:hypothetical protein SCG7086_BG_00020 [Chlamydiales bacterium SCGC AG-110-P3]
MSMIGPNIDMTGARAVNYSSQTTGGNLIKGGPATFVTAAQTNPEASIARAGSTNGYSGAMRQDTAAAVLDQAGQMIDRLGELAARASDGTMSGSDRQAMQVEADQLTGGLQDMFSNANFGGQAILQGDTHVLNVDGAINITDADGGNVMTHLSGLDLTTQAGATTALGQVKNASGELTIEKVKTANNGAALSRASDIANVRAANIDAVSSRQSDASILQAIEKLALTRVEQAKMSTIHQKMRAMKIATVDTLM